MRRFKNILVGVDLSYGDELVSDKLAPPSEEAVECACWLAKLNSADLHFFFALDVGLRTQRLIEHDEGLEYSVIDHAKEVLAGLVERSAQQGVQAGSSVTFGRSWLEMIRLVIRQGYDLVIVGTRHVGQVKGALIGSTAMKLLRKCPCPVWITQPQPHSKIESVLVATDFSAVCDDALDLGASMAKLNDSSLHIVHALEFPAESYLRFHRSLDSKKRVGYRKEVESLAQQNLTKQLARPSVEEFGGSPNVHLIEGDADVVIREQIERLHIELLVIGTVARTGIPGLLMGNVAERLLPDVSCSVLAVKPKEFQSPVTLD